MSTNTPNMKLIQSTINVDSGLLWEQNLNSSLTTIDQHNHTLGSGVQITPDGINVSKAFPFNNQPITGLQALLFTDQSALSTLNALYTINGELWYNDPTQPVQITSNGGVNALSSGITSGSATAAFNSSILVVNQAANTPANIQAGSYFMGQAGVSGSNYLTLNPPSALSSGGYTLTLPTRPASTKFLTIDSSGTISTVSSVQPTQIAASSLTGSQLASQTVAGSNMVNGTVTATQLAASQAVSSSSGSFSMSGTTYTQVTNFSVTITSAGRPIMIQAISDGNGTNPGKVEIQVNPGTDYTGFYQIKRNGSVIAQANLGTLIGASGNQSVTFPPSVINHIDVVAAGTYTYTVEVKSDASGYNFIVALCKLLVCEF